MSENVIERLAKAIGYPQEVPAGAATFGFIVDGYTVAAEAKGSEDAPRIALSMVLTDDEDAYARLAGFAAGRLLREEAILAWDPERRAAILWQEGSAQGAGEARRFFESFCESCDWWRDRVGEDAAASPRADFLSGSMFIRP